MSERPTSLDISIGAAIRAARFARGLTQSDLAAHIGVTRATVASYETGRRKIAAETLIQIAHLCGQSLGFFDPSAGAPPTEPRRTPPGIAEPTAVEQPALHALTEVLHQRPDAIPIVMEFLEAWLSDQIGQAAPDSRVSHDNA